MARLAAEHMLVEPDIFQQQLEEVLGLQAIYGVEDFVVVSAAGRNPGNGECSSNSDNEVDCNPAGSSSSGAELDADVLMAAGPPAGPVPLMHCEALVRVELPPGGVQLLIDVSRPVTNAMDADGKGTAGNLLYGPPVAYLPPMRLSLMFPSDYPETRAPHFQLHCLWLQPSQVAALASHLSDLWEEQGPGGPICFAWLEWLRSGALEHLGIDKTLVLKRRPPATQQVGQKAKAHESAALAQLAAAAAVPRPAGSSNGIHGASTSSAAVSERGCNAEQEAGQAPEEVALSVQRYAARCEYDTFLTSAHCCMVCYSDTLGTRCAWLPDCTGHGACCQSCLSQYCRTQLADGAVDRMLCPQPDCRRPLPPAVLQQLLTPDEMSRWEALLLQRTLDKMDDVVYCPRSRCRATCIEDKDHCAQCPNESWHPGVECVDAESRLTLLQQRRARSGGAGDADKIRQEVDLINQMKSLKLVQNTTRQCPMCNMAIAKSEGCNKMVCSYCDAKFCWKCGEAISGYDHFGEAKCVLFDMEEIDAWNAHMARAYQPQGARAIQIEAAREYVEARLLLAPQGLGRPCTCPQCGQMNIKEGNNNGMRCWACASHFCYICRHVIRGRRGNHFTPSGCKQHTPD